MVLLGKLHEIMFYGLISSVLSLACGKVTLTSLCQAGFHVIDFSTFFLAYLFWSSVAFLPVAIICAVATKYCDDGEGLTFQSNNVVVIIFAHLAEEIQGLILTPFWLLKDLFTHNFDDSWKIIDYISYFAELIFIIIGFATIW